MNDANNRTTIGIVGAGAMGLLFAYFFQNEYEVAVYESFRDIASSVQKGAVIDGMNGEHAIFPKISTKQNILSHADIIFIFVKCFATEDAAKAIQPFIKPDSIIVTLQNGIGNVHAIKSVLDNPLVYGTTTIGAAKVQSNRVRFGGMGQIIIGGDSDVHVNAVYSLLQKIGLPVTIAHNPDKAVWEKAVINAAINPLGALLETHNGALLQHDSTKEAMRRIIIEASDTACAHGIDIDAGTMIGAAFEVCHNTHSNYCSMLQDVLAKRKTEIDFINGAIIHYAARYAIPTPYNTTLFRLIKYKEMMYR